MPDLPGSAAALQQASKWFVPQAVPRGLLLRAAREPNSRPGRDGFFDGAERRSPLCANSAPLSFKKILNGVANFHGNAVLNALPSATMLLSLANELQAHICGFQDYHNLTVLMRVNKSLSRLVEPMLYSQVELHAPDYHEYYRYPSEIDSIPNEHRKYWTEAPVYPELKELRASYKTDSFMTLFQDTDASGPPRARREALAKHVRLLCLELSLENSDTHAADPFGIIASFQNLAHLELTMNWPYPHQIWNKAARDFLAKSHPPLENLHTLRLRGYLPKEFVQYLCRGTTGILDLELAVLDRPIGSTLVGNRMNPPRKRKSEGYEDDDDDDEDDDEDDTNENSDAENFKHEECIAPRALAALGDVNLDRQFPYLARLRLCRPAESLRRRSFQDVYVSVASDIAILKEWAALIGAARGTLEHLILDQRPFAEEIEQDSTGDEEFLRTYAYGPGYDRFVKYALPVLIEDGAEWPQLKSVHLHGFDDDAVDQSHRLLEVVAARFGPVGVVVRSDLGRRMVYEDDDGVIRGHADGFGGRRWDLDD
ncbi:hypothetical protein C8R45DRAFT_1071948 [Mycena sanguinolenta]|nr:hypothetical protein C8R45DRAFT_1071948 [Mycena sanguinolenta]